jgi:hypothetical protein
MSLIHPRAPAICGQEKTWRSILTTLYDRPQVRRMSHQEGPLTCNRRLWKVKIGWRSAGPVDRTRYFEMLRGPVKIDCAQKSPRC